MAVLAMALVLFFFRCQRAGSLQSGWRYMQLMLWLVHASKMSVLLDLLLSVVTMNASMSFCALFVARRDGCFFFLVVMEQVSHLRARV
jgi:hypothetical protein